jgi:elongation factor 2
MKKWMTSGTDANGKQLERAFNQFVLNLIFQDLWHYHGFKKDWITSMLYQLDINSPIEHNLDGKQLLKVVMQKFLPDDSLLEIIAITLTSSVTTQ